LELNSTNGDTVYQLLKPRIAKSQRLIQLVFHSAIFILRYIRIQFFPRGSLRVTQFGALQKPFVADFKVPITVIGRQEELTFIFD